MYCLAKYGYLGTNVVTKAVFGKNMERLSTFLQQLLSYKTDPRFKTLHIEVFHFWLRNIFHCTTLSTYLSLAITNSCTLRHFVAAG